MTRLAQKLKLIIGNLFLLRKPDRNDMVYVVGFFGTAILADAFFPEDDPSSLALPLSGMPPLGISLRAFPRSFDRLVLVALATASYLVATGEGAPLWCSWHNLSYPLEPLANKNPSEHTKDESDDVRVVLKKLHDGFHVDPSR